MSAGRVPNLRLRALLAEAGWTGQALANAVNAAAGENGLVLHHDRTTVAHWLAGSRPPAHVAELIAESLSRKIGRSVTLAETGLAKPSRSRRPVASDAGRGDKILSALVELGKTGPGRRSVLTGVVYSMLAARFPSFPEFAHLGGGTTTGGRGDQRIGTAHVEAATLMLRMFADHDVAFGGGRARQALGAYLANDITERLRSRASSAVHGRLAAVAADLSYLAGFMCFDDGLHGMAQKYYMTAARLAAAAGDSARYATALRGMSVQAHTLGHRLEALRLGEAAVASAPRRGGLHSAFLSGQLAVVSAAAGNHRDALRHLASAERQLSCADSAGADVGLYHRAALGHQQAEVLSLQGDLRGAIKILGLSLRDRPHGERRSRAITTARLAELRLRAGQVEQACVDWERFYEDYPYLRCARADTAVRSMRACLGPYRRAVPAARRLLALSRATDSAETGSDTRPSGRC